MVTRELSVLRISCGGIMIRYDDKCQVTCVDNGETVGADILEFKPQVLLSISLNKAIKMVLKYVAKSDEYQGDMYGRTFVSKGPKGRHYTTGR
jgi:hypothetical protein